MSDLTLYKLTPQYEAALRSLEDFHDEDLPADELAAREDALLKEWSSIEGKFVDKAKAVTRAMLGKQATADAIRTEIARLQKRLAGVERDTDWLKRYLHNAMVQTGTPKLDLGDVKVSRVKGRKSVVMVDMDEVDPEFVREIPAKYELDKKAAMDHFKKTGEIGPGWDVVEGRESLRIT